MLGLERAGSRTFTPTKAGRRRELDKFWGRVDKTGDCWVWLGAQFRDGYGRYDSTTAHRVSYEIAIGAVPAGLEVDHLCRNKLCVNPDHLEAVTRAENIRRRDADRTHCKNGHEFTPENTRFHKTHGWRLCRKCAVINSRNYRARRAGAAA